MRSVFIASVSRIDTTDGDVLAKYVSHCFEGGRGKRFREALHNSVVFTRFNKHVAAELIQTDDLATNTELAAEFSSYVESCALRVQGPKGAPLLNLLYQHFSSVGASGVALGQMHLLELKLEGNSLSNVQAFISKARYVRNGLKVDDRPSDATMFHWLWHEVKRVPCLSRITNKVRDSSNSSHRRSFQWLWDAIHDELKERREDSNYENLTKGLKTGPQAPPYGLAAGQADNPRASSAQTNKGNSESKPNSEHSADKADRKRKTKKDKKGEKESQGKQAGPSGQQGRKMGLFLSCCWFCRFGEACKLLHVGEPGSQKARQAVSESQKGKGNKGDGKGKEKERRVARRAGQPPQPKLQQQQSLLVRQ